ncbi:MAG: hypothetical protein JSR54_04425 [Proteobacteria bacterium]|nr:hypothetical protein [Pseudomonadota bacterium]
MAKFNGGKRQNRKADARNLGRGAKANEAPLATMTIRSAASQRFLNFGHNRLQDREAAGRYGALNATR